VGKIKARDVHPFHNELRDRFRGVDRWADRTNDLGASHASFMLPAASWQARGVRPGEPGLQIGGGSQRVFGEEESFCFSLHFSQLSGYNP
jgi:hypothetical protein